MLSSRVLHNPTTRTPGLPACFRRASALVFSPPHPPQTPPLAQSLLVAACGQQVPGPLEAVGWARPLGPRLGTPLCWQRQSALSGDRFSRDTGTPAPEGWGLAVPPLEGSFLPSPELGVLLGTWRGSGVPGLSMDRPLGPVACISFPEPPPMLSFGPRTRGSFLGGPPF